MFGYGTFAQLTFAQGPEAASGDVSVLLTGVFATGQAGSFTPNVLPSFTGVSGSGEAGAFTPTASFGLTGAAATSGIGAFANSIEFGLSGVDATGQVGNFTVGGDDTFDLAGVEATGQVGEFTVVITPPAGGDAVYNRRFFADVGPLTARTGLS